MKSRSVVVALLIALVATAGWWFGLYSPQNDQLAQVETDIEALFAQQQQLRNEITQLREVEANEVEIRADLDRLEDYIPSDTDQPAVIRAFQSSADAAGIEITSLTFAAPAPVLGAPPSLSPDQTLAEIPVTMVIEGSYFQVVDFFRRLEIDMPRAVLVEGVTVAESDAGFPQLATTWSGDIFAEVPVVAAAPAQTAPPGDGTAPSDAATPVPGEAGTTAQPGSNVQAASAATDNGDRR